GGRFHIFFSSPLPHTQRLPWLKISAQLFDHCALCGKTFFRLSSAMPLGFAQSCIREKQAKGLFHTSPGQTAWGHPARLSSQSEGLPHTVPPDATTCPGLNQESEIRPS